MVKCGEGERGSGEQHSSQVETISKETDFTKGLKMSKEAKCETLEKQHVHDVYTSTAHHFAGVRYKAWPRVKKFIMDLEPGSVVADVGCGNGRYMHINKSVYKLGSDRCEELVELAGQVGHEVMTCDNLKLPYRDGCFDAVVSIGVIHHLTTPKRRAAAVAELARILRPGGKLMIYVWAMEQKHRKFDGQDVLVPWHLQPKPPKSKKERHGTRRREKELSSVSSFSEDEGVCEPCLAATEYSLQEQQNLAGCTSTQHIPTCPFHSHTASSPMFLEAGIDPKCLQRNFSLPSPVRRTSLTTAERSRSWDHNCHTAQAHTHNALHTSTYKCIQFPFNTAQIPPFAKFTSLPQKNIISSKGVVMNPVLVGKEVVEPMLSGAKANPELTAAYSRQYPFVQCSHRRDHAAKVEEPVTEPKSIPAAIKSKVLGFFQRSFSPSRSSSPSPGNSDMSRRSKVKDEEYKKLVEYIMKEEAELLHCERPALEHTVSAPESSEIFAVREFPMSSQVLKRRKSRSLDEPPVIPPPRVRRKSKSLDESPCIEMSGDSNESSEDNASQNIQSHNVQDDQSIPQIYDKVLEAEQSCDSGNQSDSGVQDGGITEEQYNNNDFIAHVRNDSGTVVEDREQSYEESDDEDKEQSGNESEDSSSESEAEGKSVNIESLASEQTVKESDIPKKDEDASMPRALESTSTKSVSAELAARRNSLQLLHKQVSPVASSCSDRSSVETDCDEWARTTEAVIRSMQNQMLRRQSAIEDFSTDFDRFTTSSSGDSRLGQLSYEDINNGTSPQSPPPLPPRRGSEASTVSSDGVSVTESPSDLEESDVWKSKSNSPTENGSPVKEYQLPASSIVRNGNSSSSDSSSTSSSNQSSPGEQPAYHRFYHVFREGELVDLIERHVDNLHILSCYYDHANWCVVAEKVQVWRI